MLIDNIDDFHQEKCLVSILWLLDRDRRRGLKHLLAMTYWQALFAAASIGSVHVFMWGKPPIFEGTCNKQYASFCSISYAVQGASNPFPFQAVLDTVLTSLKIPHTNHTTLLPV